MKNIQKSHLVLLALVLLTILWSVIGVVDTYLTWVLEASPAIAGLLVLVFTYNKFRMPTFLYVIMALHMVVLLVGAHYSYAKVPLGFWMEDWFGWTRNNYDKIGHFMQGVTPALVMIELLRCASPRRFPRFTKLSNGWLPWATRPIRKPSWERRVTFGIRRRTCSCALSGLLSCH